MHNSDANCSALKRQVALGSLLPFCPARFHSFADQFALGCSQKAPSASAVCSALPSSRASSVRPQGSYSVIQTVPLSLRFSNDRLSIQGGFSFCRWNFNSERGCPASKNDSIFFYGEMPGTKDASVSLLTIVGLMLDTHDIYDWRFILSIRCCTAMMPPWL